MKKDNEQMKQKRRDKESGLTGLGCASVCVPSRNLEGSLIIIRAQPVGMVFSEIKTVSGFISFAAAT